MAGVIDEKSAVKYAGQNMQLAIFCFERDELRDKLLEVWFIEDWNKTTNSRARYRFLSVTKDAFSLAVVNMNALWDAFTA
jgi:hypothetical protein